MGSLCDAYRGPLIKWLLARGLKPHDAEDIVQGLFMRLLRRDFLVDVSKEKGRFRTFLLTCLRNYINDLHGRGAAAKRGGGQPLESLDETDDQGRKLHEPHARRDGPDFEYDRAWAQSVLAHALRRLEEECAVQGHSSLCAALEPVMFADEAALPYQRIAERLGMTEAAVKMAAHRIRARLKGLVREEILQTITNEEDWRDEVRYLIDLFARPDRC